MPVARFLAAYTVSLAGGTVIYTLLTYISMGRPIGLINIGGILAFAATLYLFALFFFAVPFLLLRLLWFRIGWNGLPAAIAGGGVLGAAMILYLLFLHGVSSAGRPSLLELACLVPAGLSAGWIQWKMEEFLSRRGNHRSTHTATKDSS